MGKQVSLVLELQKLASDSKVSVAELARKALMVASKLGLSDFKRWIELELHGYVNEDVPAYRIIGCQISAFNPYRGWIPIIFPDKKSAEAWTRVANRQSVGELEALVLKDDGEGRLQIPFPSHVAASLMEAICEDFFPNRFCARSQIVGILDAVRNTILEWALKLEEQSILGEGLTFSEEEREKARTTDSVHIEHFHGVFGTVQAHNVQIGEYASINKQLERAGVSQEERNELKNILDELKTARGEKRKSIVQRGLDWVNRSKVLIGNLGQLIIGWLNAGGNGSG